MNTEGLNDIRGPVALPGDGWWLWLLLAVVVTGVLVAVFFFFRRKARRPVVQPKPVPPWEKALAELARLEQLSPKGEAEVKQFYFLLSGVVRLYIEERFDIRAPEMTTEEFMERARCSPALSQSQKDFLNNFLNVSDMVKFARFEPSSGDRAESLASARRFVENTVKGGQSDL